MKIFRLLSFALLLGSIYANAQSTQYDYYTGCSPHTGIVDVNIQNMQLTKNFGNQENRSIKAELHLQFDLGDDYYEVSTTDYELEIGYEVSLQNGGVSVGSLLQGTVIMNRDEPRILVVLDIIDEIQIGATTADIYITMPDVSLIDEPWQTHITNNFRFNACIFHQYGVGVRSATNATLLAPVSITAMNALTDISRYVEFSWTPPAVAAGFPNYEVQILRLFNTWTDHADNLEEIKTYVDWTKALKVETQSSVPYLRIAVAEGSGYYLWRVRPIGNFWDGGIGNSDNYGQWSVAPAQGDIVALRHLTMTEPAAFYLTDNDENINWIYNRIFTESDLNNNGVRVSEGMGYADPLLYIRQKQAHQGNSINDNLVTETTNGTTIVSQTLTDFSGRASFTTLPVPIAGELGNYKTGFVLNNEATPTLYTAEDFDLDNNLLNPSKIKDNDGAFKYYSGENYNGNDFVSDAEGYAFTRTVFANDGTGRVIEQSGVGSRHALGAQNSGHGRTTRTINSTATDKELIRLFGDEAPIGETVLKTIVIDPNNIYSVTYTSKEGNIIATALVSDNTYDLNSPEQIANNLVSSANSVTNSTVQNMLAGKSFISSRKLAFPIQTIGTLGYDLLPKDAADMWMGCPNGDCAYSLMFFIHDVKRNTTYKSNIINNVTQDDEHLTDLEWTGGGALPVDERIEFNVDGMSVKMDFPEGEYMVSKALFPNFADNAAFAEIDDFDESYGPILDAIGEWMSSVQNEADYTVFEGKMQTLSDMFMGYNLPPHNVTEQEILDQLGITDPDYMIPSGFGVMFDATLGSDDDAVMTINTGCCGPAVIPIDKPPVCVACAEIDIQRAGTPDFNAVFKAVKVQFIGYLVDRLIYSGDLPQSCAGIIDQIENGTLLANFTVISDEFMAQLAPGFTDNSMAYMITNMLISSYNTGNSMLNGSAWIKAVIDDETQELVPAFHNTAGELVACGLSDPVQLVKNGNPYNYKCEELFDCWFAVVNMLNGFDFSEDDDTNPMDEFNERNGPKSNPHDNSGEPGKEDSAAGEHADNPENRPLKDRILSFFISRKLRKFSNSDKGAASKDRMEQQVVLSNLFMECAGYQFCAVLDDNTSVGTQYGEYNSMESSYVSHINTHTVNSETNDIDLMNLDAVYVLDDDFFQKKFYQEHKPTHLLDDAYTYELYYPYIIRPEWMFKYYVYNTVDGDGTQSGFDNGIADNSMILSNQIQIELSSCYNKPTCTDPNMDLCFNPCRGIYHENWSSGQRLNFYQQIKYAPVFEENKQAIETVDETNTCPSYNQLTTMASDEITRALNTCANRKPGMRNSIIAMFRQAGYIITDCPAEAGSGELVVTMYQIEGMVENAYQQCITIVNQIAATINSNGYPLCDATNFCYMLDANGNCISTDGSGNPWQDPIIKLFSPCDQEKLNMIFNWRFIPTLEQNCDDTDPLKPECSDPCPVNRETKHSIEYTVVD